MADQKVAIVTGGGYGIGRGIAQSMAASGWTIVVYDLSEEKARETQRLVSETGRSCEVFPGDVTNWTRVQEGVAWTLEHFGRIDGLVNDAAARYAGNILEITEEQWDFTVSIVLKGPFLMCKAVIPHMIEAGGGAIVNISSADSYGRKGMIPYAAAKGGINTLTLCLAADHIQDHIRVNAVLPGFTVTGMTEHYPPERLEASGSRLVAGRPGQPADVADMVDYLMSDKAETITGSIFGGLPLANH
jgi:NAD(P)-dependent dehydrogenase (short-subunit alcohol dehydrogenase family)